MILSRSMKTPPDPLEHPLLFLDAFLRTVGPTARGELPRETLERWVPGLTPALTALGHGAGRAYEVGFAASGRSWQLWDNGACRTHTPRVLVDAEGKGVPARQWEGGIYVLIRQEPLHKQDVIGPQTPPDPAGTLLMARLIVFEADAAAPTCLTIREAPTLVKVEGRPDPLAFLRGFTPADRQAAIRGGAQ